MTVSQYQEATESVKKAGIAPIFSCLRVTSRCNMNCNYCSVNLGAGRELSLTEWKTAIDILYSLGNRQINLSGGEPLLRTDIFDLIRYGKGKRMFVSLSTNGILATPEVARNLDSSGLDSLVVSLDTTDNEKSNQMKHLEGLRKANLTKISQTSTHFKVIISPVINKQTMRQLPDIAYYCRQMGFSMRTMLFMGQALSSSKRSNLELTREDAPKLQEIFKLVTTSRELDGVVLDTPDYFSAAVEYVKGNYRFRCIAGLELSINNDGRIIICPDVKNSVLTIFDLNKKENFEKICDQVKKFALHCQGCFWSWKFRLREQNISKRAKLELVYKSRQK